MDDDVLALFGHRDDSENSGGEEEMKEDQDASGNKKNDIQFDVSYDTSLPTQHTYLGTDLEELSGRTVLDDNSCQQLPLLTLPGVVLVPGQTLPLQLFQPAAVSMMKFVMDRDRTFGMVNSRYSGPGLSTTMAPIGTTAEIRSFSEVVDEHVGLSTLRVKAEGRQRFEVLETRRQTDGHLWNVSSRILMAKVRILPEVVLGDPGEGARLSSLNRFRIAPPTNLDRITSRMKHLGHRLILHSKGNSRKYNRHEFANYTWWPPWVYQQYDSDLLMKRIEQELLGWNRSLRIDAVPRNPIEFSFWVAANLPLDDTLRLNLLAFNSAIQRLRCELSILEKYTILCCRDCSAQVADRRDIFSMSLEGPQGTYVNSHGYVHETITVYKAQGLSLAGDPTTEYSWFPGYAWTIVQCRNCSGHMGWKFTSQNRKLHPEKFWGLCRSALLPGLRSDEEGEEWMPLV